MKSRTLQFRNSVIEYRYFNSNDSKNGIPIIFAGGVIGTHLIWSGIIKILREKYNIVIWNYPGLSGRKEYYPLKNKITLPFLVQCQKAVMDELYIEQAVLAGWSLGPLVNTEFIYKYKKMCSALIALSGWPGASFLGGNKNSDIKNSDKTIFSYGSLMPYTANWLYKHKKNFEKLKKHLKKSDHPTKWAKRFGLVSPDINELAFDAILKEFINVPIETYINYLSIASNSNVKNRNTVKGCPILAAAGNNDLIGSTKNIKNIISKIKDAEFMNVKGATHFLPLEYPQLLALKIETFLKENIE